MNDPFKGAGRARFHIPFMFLTPSPKYDFILLMSHFKDFNYNPGRKNDDK